MRLISAVLLAAVLTVVWACKAPTEVQKEWWQTALFYQIYPRSFKDSNGDGVGDLNGITSKLEYLKEIGVTATWLSPIFTSPMVDFGYDIANFTEIDPIFGTLEDFDNMIKKANELGIKIVLDFVPNHSSDLHEWFIRSERREPGYEDLYIWDSGLPHPSDPNKRLPPSNWLSHFRGSAWKWSDIRKQFYYHAFAEGQPDFNYRNEKLVQLMKNVLKFWLDRGVAGFRCDTVPDLFEKEPVNGRYLDEPRNYDDNDPDSYGYLQHPYVVDQPETIDMSYQWREVLLQHQAAHGGDSRILLIETYSPAEYSNQFYGNKTTEGAQIPFNFNLIMFYDKDKNAEDLITAIDKWMDILPYGRTPNWVIGNHDQKRASTRYGVGRIDFMNMVHMLLPGITVTYQGEELGMLDGEISWEDTVDPAACNSNPDIYEEFTRDPCRTPFHWDATKNAGFTTGDKTWLPMAPEYQTRNVAVEKSSLGRTHLKVFLKLIELRKEKVIQNGLHSYTHSNKNIFVLKRWLPSGDVIVLISNLGKTDTIFNLNQHDPSLPNMEIILSDVNSSKEPRTSLNLANIPLKVNEAVVARGKLTSRYIRR